MQLAENLRPCHIISGYVKQMYGGKSLCLSSVQVCFALLL